MDCEYILVYRLAYRTRSDEGNELQHKFHATTPEEATETAREIIKYHQAKSERDSPLALIVVEGELYRQMQELDSREFIKKSNDIREERNPTPVDRP